MDDKIEPCPYCGEPCEADWVDVGFGSRNGVQASPYHCYACGATQIGPHDTPRELTEDEKRTGWYAPASKLPPEVNTFHGQFVSLPEAEALYRFGLLDKKKSHRPADFLYKDGVLTRQKPG